ncbi:MAG: hypothetical protein AAFO15_01260 [Pseudomonadota bacterium]
MKRKAIIDIGTNAVRGVVYDNNTLGSLEIANTQFSHNFHNNNNRNTNLFTIMQHYKTLQNNLKINEIQLVGTASMRAFDSQSLIQEIKNKFNFHITVLSGAQEAQYVGKAIQMSINNANGVIADLGGGSLELSCIENNNISNIVSINIYNNNNIIKTIRNSFNFASAQNLENLYLVGGSFRLLVKQYAYTMNYPHELISHYLCIPTKQIVNFIQSNIQEKYNKTNNILIEIINNLKTKYIIISNYGLKEGVHFASFRNKTHQDLILEKTQNITQAKIDDMEFAKYTEIIRNLIPLHVDKYLYIFKIALLFAKMNNCVNYIHQNSLLSNWILKINIPFSLHNRIMLYVIMQNIFSHTYEHTQHLKLIDFLPNQKFYVAKIFAIILNITYNIHGCFPKQLNYNLFLCNKNAFIKCFNILHHESFNRVIHSTKKLTELIKKLHLKQSMSNYKY